MELEVLKKIASESQRLARKYAHHQNLGNVALGDPPPPVAVVPTTFFGRLKLVLFGPVETVQPPSAAQTVIDTMQMTDIVNALLNSGNALEYMVRGEESKRQLEEVK